MKAVLALFIVILAAGCVEPGPEYDPSRETIMEFVAGPCDRAIDPYDSSQHGVRETKWTQEGLEVNAYVSINCAEEIEGGDFLLEGDRVTLYYEAPRCQICTLCNCAHMLTYTFGNIERKNYVFELSRK